MSNKSGAEYNSLIQFRSDLINGLQDNLSVSDQLLEVGLVTEDVYEWSLTAQGVSNREKARRLVNCVTACIRFGQSVDKFNIFIEILQRNHFLSCVAERILAEYRCQLNKNSVLPIGEGGGRGKQEGMHHYIGYKRQT